MPYNYLDNLPGMKPPGATPGINPAATTPGTTSPYADNRLQMDPALMAQLLGTHGDQLELDALEKQLEQARALRDTGLPEGRQAGRVYVAANPLEHIGALMRQARGYREERELEEGVRNEGYGPGVTREPQPEYKREGTKQIRKRLGENVRKVGEEYFKKGY